jgi:hypothetical protein
MKSRLAILSMLVFGMLLSTTGAGLAVSGVAGESDAGVAQYGTSAPTPTGGGNVLGDEDSGNNDVLPEQSSGGKSPSNAVQPARQVEAGTNTNSKLPFTGFAAVPILLGGIALLSAGLVLRRRTGEQR